mmetsp:Transcript_16586/g.51562  ORF Transcript_16586/g.51562 Transcript_16586/m.51562 type:complete len:414 (-) Transcript_16586:385-1626(-)
MSAAASEASGMAPSVARYRLRRSLGSAPTRPISLPFWPRVAAFFAASAAASSRRTAIFTSVRAPPTSRPPMCTPCLAQRLAASADWNSTKQVPLGAPVALFTTSRAARTSPNCLSALRTSIAVESRLRLRMKPVRSIGSAPPERRHGGIFSAGPASASSAFSDGASFPVSCSVLGSTSSSSSSLPLSPSSSLPSSSAASSPSAPSPSVPSRRSSTLPIADCSWVRSASPLAAPCSPASSRPYSPSLSLSSSLSPSASASPLRASSPSTTAASAPAPSPSSPPSPSPVALRYTDLATAQSTATGRPRIAVPLTLAMARSAWARHVNATKAKPFRRPLPLSDGMATSHTKPPSLRAAATSPSVAAQARLRTITRQRLALAPSPPSCRAQREAGGSCTASTTARAAVTLPYSTVAT